MADIDLTGITRLLNAILTRLDTQEELLEELTNKVDEINLPSGEGFSIERES